MSKLSIFHPHFYTVWEPWFIIEQNLSQVQRVPSLLSLSLSFSLSKCCPGLELCGEVLDSNGKYEIKELYSPPPLMTFSACRSVVLFCQANDKTFDYPRVRDLIRSIQVLVSALFECARDEFACYDLGGCVPRGQLCDGEYDCTDGSDELTCPPLRRRRRKRGRRTAACSCPYRVQINWSPFWACINIVTCGLLLVFC